LYEFPQPISHLHNYLKLFFELFYGTSNHFGSFIFSALTRFRFIIPQLICCSMFTHQGYFRQFTDVKISRRGSLKTKKKNSVRSKFNVVVPTPRTQLRRTWQSNRGRDDLRRQPGGIWSSPLLAQGQPSSCHWSLAVAAGGATSSPQAAGPPRLLKEACCSSDPSLGPVGDLRLRGGASHVLPVPHLLEPRKQPGVRNVWRRNVRAVWPSA
jgi:hypothetical protein